MGKKKGQQQRTKGNVLPSSSVRSADLLTREGVNAGLGSFQSLPSLGLGNIPELAGLDSIAIVEFRTVLKKLYKRDITTKLKALAEFGDLCMSCKQHEVLTVLPYWPRVYNKLFEDSERRVREGAQKAMNSLVTAAGKNLALQLKNIMGCWYISQCDPYSPTAMAAEAGIAEAFSGDKKIEAFVFCRKEILKTITSFLFGPQAKREKLSEQEGNNYHRIMASSLEALALYIRNVSHHSMIDQELEEILNDNKMWKFQKHSNPSIRGGYYSVLESLCIICPDILRPHIKEACKSTFHRLNESNIAICKPLFAASVALVATYNSWHEHIDIHKGLVPGLCGSLKEGCHGLGSYVLPCLLPICAKLPITSDDSHIFSKIFDSVRECLQHNLIKLSRHSSELAITSFTELLRLFVSRTVQPNDVEVNVKIVIQENIVKVLEDTFAGQNMKYGKVLFYELISGSVHTWTAKTFEPEASIVYAKVCGAFWSEIRAAVHQYTLVDNINLISLKVIVQFLQALHSSQACVKSKKRRRSVKFADVVEDGKSQSVNQNVYVFLPEVQNFLQENINKILSESILLHPLKQSQEMISIYCNIFKVLGNPNLFRMILQRTEGSESENIIDPAKKYIENVLLLEIDTIIKDEQDPELVKLLSNILFSVIAHCETMEDFPINLRSLFSSETCDPKFAICADFLCNMTLNIGENVKFGKWIAKLLSNENGDVWKFIFGLIDWATTCKCNVEHSVVHYLEVNQIWTFLNNILTKTIKEPEFEPAYLCGQQAFTAIVQKMLPTLKSLQISCSSSNCYEFVLQKFASLMFSCVPCNFDVTNLSENCTSIWEWIMTTLLRSYCMSKDSDSNLMSVCLSYFTLAVKNESPFDCAKLPIDDYVEEQTEWVKKNLLLSSVNDSETIVKLKSVADLFLISQRTQNLFLSTLLPSSEVWTQVNNDCDDFSNIEEDLCLILNDNSLEEVDSESISEKYFSLVNITCEVISYVKDVLGENFNVVFDEQDKFVLLAEECCIASIYKSRSFPSFLDVLGDSFKVKFKAHIMKRAMNEGGVWALCLFLIGESLLENECDIALESLHTACHGNLEVSVPLFQTLTVLFKNVLTPEKVDDISNIAIDKVLSTSLVNIKVSEMYLFSLGTSKLSNSCSDKVECIRKCFDFIVKLRNEREDLFLFDDSLSSADRDLLKLNSDIASLLSSVVQNLSEDLTEAEWDFICCSLISWIENLSNCLDFKTDKSVTVLLLIKSCRLFDEINKFISSPTASDDPAIPLNLVSEWKEFFSMTFYSSLMKIFVNIGTKQNHIWHASIHAICNSMLSANAKSVLDSIPNLKPRLSPDSNLPDSMQTLLNHLCPMLEVNDKTKRKTSMVQLTAFKILTLVSDQMIKTDDVTVPDAIFNVLKKSVKCTESLFVSSNVEVMKSSNESEDSDSEPEIKEDPDNSFQEHIEDNIASVIAYLLTWKLLINLTQYVPSEHKVKYIDSLMKSKTPNVTEDLLPKLYKLMISNSSHFRTNPVLFYDTRYDMENIEHIAASLYLDFLIQMPAASRTWYNELPKSIRSRVDKFTSTYVSPVLIEKEFKAVQLTKQQQAMESMEISARPAVREVRAMYRLNEIQMEIAVCLSPNHPLGPITVNTEKRAGVVMGQWRYWILQITTFLQYQNGGIIDGLLLWKNKVDKKFEGLEECMICFSVVHGSNQSLPKLKCKTCKKKYHAECLYKWFDTSGNSTCPLCRSPMIFR